MFPILYEDVSVMVIDKPAGIPCTRQDGRQRSVADILVEYWPALAEVGDADDGGLVHRLDNDTSGCLAIAKTPAAYNHLRQQFDAATIYKEYEALVIGHPPETGHCALPIVHNPRKRKRMRGARPGEDARAAHTEWRVLHYYPISPQGPAGFAHLQICITTGVRHQIRVHMAHIGHPLVGDRMYQSRTQRARDNLAPSHHLLHAACIGFAHPTTQAPMSFNAPRSHLFARTLKTLDEIEKRR